MQVANKDVFRLPTRQMFLRLFQIGLAVDLCELVGIQMAREGILSREQVSFAPGIHWYAILIFLIMILGYVLVDDTSLLLLPPMALAYYALHEGVFNLFFLSYHGFSTPPHVSASWYWEMGGIVAILLVFVPLVVIFKGRLFRAGSWGTALKLWIAFAVFNLIWIAVGYPVTVNVYNLSHYASANTSTVANAFELLYNALFSLSFFFTFVFHLRKRRRGVDGTRL